jgi:hypothetical protein
MSSFGRDSRTPASSPTAPPRSALPTSPTSLPAYSLAASDLSQAAAARLALLHLNDGARVRPMRISHISIESIRSHAAARSRPVLVFHKLLHGPNGSGKSSCSLPPPRLLAPHDSASAVSPHFVPRTRSPFCRSHLHLSRRGVPSPGFLHSPASVLESHTPAAGAIAKGKQADARLREFLGAAPGGKAPRTAFSPPSSGPSKAISPSLRSSERPFALAEQLDSPAAQRLIKWIDNQAANY